MSVCLLGCLPGRHKNNDNNTNICNAHVSARLNQRRRQSLRQRLKVGRVPGYGKVGCQGVCCSKI